MKRSSILLLLSLLILLLAAPAAQAYSGNYYIIPHSVSLRDCPSYDCRVFLTGYQGEKVKILEQTGMWSQVRFVDRSGIGWLPTNQLSYSPDLRGGPQATYYVNKNGITLHDEPNPNSRVLKTLHFNEAVEMLGVGASGWAQIRDPQTSMVGYLPPRYLSSEPLRYPKSHRRRRHRAPKPAPKKEPAAAPKAM